MANFRGGPPSHAAKTSCTLNRGCTRPVVFWQSPCMVSVEFDPYVSKTDGPGNLGPSLPSARKSCWDTANRMHGSDLLLDFAVVVCSAALGDAYRPSGQQQHRVAAKSRSAVRIGCVGGDKHAGDSRTVKRTLTRSYDRCLITWIRRWMAGIPKFLPSRLRYSSRGSPTY